ncbi:MAG: zinc-ribbon domain-containing protein [Promethearchaeota archaeon]
MESENISIMEDFKKLGEYLYYMALFMVLSIFLSCLSIVSFVYQILIISTAKNIAKKKYNEFLKKFANYFLYAIIINVISSGIMVFGVVKMYVFLLSDDYGGYYGSGDPFELLIDSYVFIFIGLVIVFISQILNYIAYNNLEKCFQENFYGFPPHASLKLTENAKKLRISALLMIFGILVVPAIVGLIYYLIGAFGLSDILKNLNIDIMTSQGYGYNYPPQFSIPKTNTINTNGQYYDPNQNIKSQTLYCKYCGAKIRKDAKFCQTCGRKV